MRIFFKIFPLLLCACTTVQQFTGPNGKAAYSIECGDMGDCYKKAGEVCSIQGYTIINNTSKTVGIPQNGGTLIVTNQNLAIECK